MTDLSNRIAVLCQRADWPHRAAESDANGRLMAAAPDLLAALKAMVNRWEPDTEGADRRMWEAACEAIRKAEGKS